MPINRTLQKLYRLLTTGNRKPFVQLEALAKAFNKADNAPDVLCFGDSVMERAAREDVNPATLGDFITEKLAQSGLKTCCITHSAYHPAVYYYLCRALSVMAKKPQVVILPVNLRCFSPQWDWNPAWQFDGEIRALQQYLSDPRSVPTVAQPMNVAAANKRFHNRQVDYPLTEFKRIGQFMDVIESDPQTPAASSERSRQIFIYHYLHPLTAAHPKIGFLRQTASLLQSLNIRLASYITPINVRAGVRFVGDSFETTIEAQARLITEAMSQQPAGNILFSDWSRQFESQYFFHPDLATEHLNEMGRQLLAGMVADLVHKQFAEHKTL